MSRRPTLLHRVEYTLFVTASAIAGALPRRAADWLGGALGRIAYLAGIRRELTEAQLRRAFPEHDDGWVRRTAHESYVHLGRETLAMLRMESMSPAEIASLTSDVEGVQAFVDAGRAGGVVVVTGHFGNWEVAATGVVARGLALDVVIQKQGNPLFDRALVRQRERHGMRVIYKSKAPREALTALREGRVVAFVSDQDARRKGVFVPFFGRPASTPRGPGVMAVRTGSPIFLGYAIRGKDGAYVAGVEEIVVSRDGDVDTVVERLTAAYTARLEQLIRQAPEQYFWQHRRWKTAPGPGPEKRQRSS
jgi:KDO2-lipid IV(A) lauroyltransferase